MIQLEYCHREEEGWGRNMTYVLLKVELLSQNNTLNMMHSFAMFKDTLIQLQHKFYFEVTESCDDQL